MVTREPSYLQRLADYVKKNVKKGYTAESLRWALVKQGYTRSEVDRAIILANEQLASEAPKIEIKPAVSEIVIEKPVKEKTGFWKKIFG